MTIVDMTHVMNVYTRAVVNAGSKTNYARNLQRR